MERITAFKLFWYDSLFISPDDRKSEEVSIYRDKGLLVSLKYDGKKNLKRGGGRLKLDKKRVNELFELLEKYETEWEPDYTIRVCDGSSWKILMWHSSHKVTKICGTVEYPPHGKQVEDFIRSLVEGAENQGTLRLFGCNG